MQRVVLVNRRARFTYFAFLAIAAATTVCCIVGSRIRIAVIQLLTTQRVGNAEGQEPVSVMPVMVSRVVVRPIVANVPVTAMAFVTRVTTAVPSVAAMSSAMTCTPRVSAHNSH